MEVARLAVKTGFFPLFEIENGILKFNTQSKRLIDKSNREPLEKFLNMEGRFKKFSKEDIEALQADVDAEWDALKRLM
ncbi:MAG: hypothetical protein ACFFBD_26980 [Candidatus Hodarchaeota archaeon]